MKMNPHTKEAYDLFHDGNLALAKAERQGIRFDEKQAKRNKYKLVKKIEILEKKIYDSEFFAHWQKNSKEKVNIYSNDQLGNYLYKVLELQPAKTTASGKGSTDEEALKELDIPEINKLLKIRKLKKIKDTYLKQFERENVNGQIHPNFNLNFVRTYRGSSNNPNFQNVPKRDEEARKMTRSCLYPRKGHQLLEIDYGQLEVRIAACYNNDQKLIYDILHGDMHRDMASEIFMLDIDKSIKGHSTLRKAAKNGFIFPQFYGDYYVKCAKSMACDWGELPKEGTWKKQKGLLVQDGLYLSDHLRANGIKNLKQFTEHVRKIEDDFWTRRYSTYQHWKDTWYAQYQKKGYIDLKTGFRCTNLMSKNDAVNYPIQGSAFHCLLWSLTRVDFLLDYYQFDTKIIGQIHDSIILDVHPDELDRVCELVNDVTVRQLTEKWDWITVPLEVDAELGKVDGSWDTMEEYPEFLQRSM